MKITILAQSESDPKKQYEIKYLPSFGRWGCTCPHWQHRCVDNDQDCKHIKALKEIWLPTRGL